MSHSENDEEEYNIVFCYDPSQDKWTTLPPLSISWFGLGQVNDKLVAVGGRDELTTSATDRMYTYDDLSQSWKQTIPLMPTARWSPGVLSLQSALVVAGGLTSVTKTGFFGRTLTVITSLDTIEIFKPDISQWYRTDPLPTACHDVSLVAIGNTCYALGGCPNDGTFSGLNQALYASVDDLLGNAVPANQTTHSGSSDTQSAWKTLPNTPTYHPPAAVLAGKLITLGRRSIFRDDEIYVYVTSTNTWAHCGELALPVRRSHIISVSVLSPVEIIVIAGKNAYKGTPMFF